VSAAVPLVVYAAWLAAGFAFVLWGLRIFKAYVALIGTVAGASLASGISAIVVGDGQAIAIAGVIGAIAGLVLAWPLQKLLVFLAAGSAGALFGSVITVALERTELIVPASIAGFLLAGIAVLALYETIVVCAMAFQGAQAVFHAVFVPADAYSGSLREIGARLLGLYADNVIALGATTMLFIGFALWYQKGVARRRDPADPHWPVALAARRISVRYAALILATWIVTAALSISGQWSLSSFDLAGMHALSWPLVTMVTLMLLRPRPVPLAVEAAVPARRRSWRLLRIAAFGVVVPPVVTAALFMAYGAPWQTISGFYESFLQGPSTALAAKLGYSLAVLPLLLSTAVPRLTVVAPPAPPAAPEATPTDSGTTPQTQQA